MNNKEIYNRWINAWNKDLSYLDNIVDDHCVVHQARTDGKDSKIIRGPEALMEIIKSGKYYFNDSKMTLEIGPISDGNYVSARWTFTGKYNGKMNDATAEEGDEVSFSGTDIFHIEKEKIKDYWVSSDVVDFMKQIGLSN